MHNVLYLYCTGHLFHRTRKPIIGSERNLRLGKRNIKYVHYRYGTSLVWGLWSDGALRIVIRMRIPILFVFTLHISSGTHRINERSSEIKGFLFGFENVFMFKFDLWNVHGAAVTRYFHRTRKTKTTSDFNIILLLLHLLWISQV